jgi:ATP-dependent RNA helicase DOB1
LQHYLFPTGAQGIFLVVDEKGQFRENNFAKAIQVIEDDLSISKLMEEKKQKGNKQQKQNASQEMRKLITLIVSKGLDPCIVFSFSKRECEAYSVSLKNCDFNVETERDSVEKIFKNAMETLSEEDQQLPQITMILPLLKRGIGIHHGGLLPIVKEVIELLF